MWPIKLDMTRDECRGVLRRLELESYSSVMSTFRAQGLLSKEKARMLEDLRKMLHISQDRHKAEARRVANDERLTTVAEIISGPNSTQDWCREGRRTFPILPRTVPYTALTYIANTVCEQISRENAKRPHPFETSKNRLEKEQEEAKKMEEEQKKLPEETSQTLKSDPEPTSVPPTVPPEPAKDQPPDVVTIDPFVEAANKSYIINDLKRTYPVDTVPQRSTYTTHEDESPLRKKPQLYQELQKQEPLGTFSLSSPYHQQPFPVHSPLSPHKLLSSPTNFGTPPNNSSNNNSVNNFSAKSTQGKNSNKGGERQRKTSVSSKKSQSKSRASHQTSKQTGGTRASKNNAPIQTQAQPQSPLGISTQIPAKGGGKGSTNLNSPHLIHSYASPILPHEIQPQGVGDIFNEPLQLQKHLTSNIVYQTQQAQQPYGLPATSAKAQPLVGAYNTAPQAQPTSNSTSNTTFNQQQILPSSKKDIQYNLTKLNPTSNAPLKNNITIPTKQSSSSIIQSKGHPLFNYQKKSPSKNVLIPTSSAAAALASLGIPKPIQRKDTPGGKFREPEMGLNPADIPNPKIIFSTSTTPIQTGTSSSYNHPDTLPQKSSGITILDQITLRPPNMIIQPSTSSASTSAPPPLSVTQITPGSTAASSTPLAVIPPKATGIAPISNKVVTLKGPNLAGFTPVKGGNKLSVHKLQLVPIQPGGKNNVIVLPAKSVSGTPVSGTLNPGQKITISKSSVMSSVPADPTMISVAANAISPPKVIVQQQPDLNNIVVFDIASEQKLKTTSGMLGSQQQTQGKSVITEDTPVDIVSTPLDVVTGAVKLQELSKGFLSPASSSATSTSPLTDKMIKPQGIGASKYNANSNNSSIAKATKFEADSTAPGPSVTVTKKTKANHQGRLAPVAKLPMSATVQNSKVKLTTAVASSTTVGSDTAVRTPVMSSTDWELELDQANQASSMKTSNLIPKVASKTVPKSNQSTPIAPKPVLTLPGNISSSSVGGGRKTIQPLSSSSISSTSSSNASSPVVEHAAPTDKRIPPVQRPIVPVPVPTPQTPPNQKTIPLPLVTTPPNERSDDTSATDSADAEEDPEVGEDDDPIEEMIIDDEQHFNAVIEEDPDPDEALSEQDIHGERVEIVNVGYDTSRALIADLEGAEGGGHPTVVPGGAILYNKTGNGVEINPSSMNFEQYIEEATEGESEANGPPALPVSETSATTTIRARAVGAAGSSKGIMFEMLEIDAEGNKHTRTMSFEEALAERQIAAKTKVGGSAAGAGTIKGKTKSTT